MKTNLILLFSLLLLIPGIRVNACTSYLVTKGASADGSTMITYAADSHIRYGELYWNEAAEWPEGSLYTMVSRATAKPFGQIPQTEKTYQVVGYMNEFQVAIGESTFGGRRELRDTTGIIDYAGLMFVALQRSKNAREAIKVMVELVDEFGFNSSGESFSIADPNEVWILEMIGKGSDMAYDRRSKTHYNKNRGAVWVAKKIPDGYVSAHANHSRITSFPLNDQDNSISSKELDKIFNPEIEVVYAHDVISFAKDNGYYLDSDGEFSFSQAYAPIDFGSARFCELRVWVFFNAISDGMEKYLDHALGKDMSIRMPLYVKPNRKLTPADLMAFKRNYMQGTDYDMTKDVGAEPHGLPYRWRPLTWEYDGKEYFNERVTVTQQTGFSWIAQMRSWLPDPIGGVFWFGVDDAGSCVYVPFYCGIKRTPRSWAEGYGDILTYKDDAAFWVFNRVAHFLYLFYDRTYEDLRKNQAYLENKFHSYQNVIDNAALSLYEKDANLAREFLTDYSVNMAQYTVEYWKKFGEFLLVKYLDGNIKHEKDGEFLRNPYGYPLPPMWPGYSDKWKRNLIKETGEKYKVID